MPHEESPIDPDEMVFEEVRHGENHFKRTGKLKATGVTGVEIILDERRRELQKTFFDDHGQMRTRVIYEYDAERKPRLITTFDREGNIVMKHERGKRPVITGSWAQ